MSRKRIGALLALAGAVLVALLWIAGPRAVIETLRGARPGSVIAATLCVLVGVICKSQAIKRLLGSADADVSSWRSFLAYGGAMFGKHLLPLGRAGSVVLVPTR